MSTRVPVSNIFIAGAMAACALLGGCGGGDGFDRAAVSGSVTFDGEPVETGTIAFHPDAGTTGPVSGIKISAGRYEIEEAMGPVVGNQKVEILAIRETGELGPVIPPSPERTKITEQYIPKKYNKKTTLTVVIESGDNEDTNFDLNSK